MAERQDGAFLQTESLHSPQAAIMRAHIKASYMMRLELDALTITSNKRIYGI